MKTILLLSTLAIGSIAATSSFAQSSTTGPTYPYPQGYQETETSGQNWGGQSNHYFHGRPAERH